MAVIERFYPVSPEYLLNAVYDVAEMRKAKVTKTPEENSEVSEVEFVTEMYQIKTSYLFRLLRETKGTTLTVESGGDEKNALRDVQLMFTVLDGFANQLITDSK